MKNGRRYVFPLIAAFFLLPLAAQEGGVEQPAGEEDKTEVVLTKEQKKAAEKLAREKKAAEKAEKKRKKKERTDPYLGVVYLPVTNYSVKNGSVQVALRGGTGSFNIFALNRRRSAVPVLSDVDDSSSSYFAVLVDGYEYRLNHAAGCVPEVRELEESGQLAYKINGLLQVVIGFTPLSSAADGSADMVRLTVYVTSLSDKTQKVAVKALFDTILGENRDYHFTTASGGQIDAACQFLSFDDERWVASSNGKTTAQFLLSGKTVSPVEAVTVANRDELYRSRWIPVIKERSGFNGVLAYNNSALAISWPAFELEPEKTGTITMYIALASDGESPRGEEFLEEVTVVEPVVEETAPDKNGFVIRKPDVEFVVPPITDKQLDPAYIQQLIDRIDSLQSDPELVDRTEVRQLNAELDAILEKIRQ